MWATNLAHRLSKIGDVVGGWGCTGVEFLLGLGHGRMYRKKPCQQLRMVIFLPVIRLSGLAYLIQFQVPPFFAPFHRASK